MRLLSCKFCSIHLLTVFLLGCSPAVEESANVQEEIVSADATDSFVMRNPEIREDLLQQLEIHNIEFWTNEDNSIGFYVKDTKEVDRLANEAIGVYISLQ
jgi:hypothetical protein